MGLLGPKLALSGSKNYIYTHVDRLNELQFLEIPTTSPLLGILYPLLLSDSNGKS